MPHPSGRAELGTRRYCLDANISYRVSQALTRVTWPVTHVSLVAQLGSDDFLPGRCDAPDADIGRWCRDTQTVLITLDDDFKARRARAWTMAGEGAEVILFEFELAGVQQPHAEITRLLPVWERALGRYEYGPRLWRQVRNRTTPVLDQRAAGSGKGGSGRRGRSGT